MKRIIRITEQDISRIVQRIVKEQSENDINNYYALVGDLKGIYGEEKVVLAGSPPQIKVFDNQIILNNGGVEIDGRKVKVDRWKTKEINGEIVRYPDPKVITDAIKVKKESVKDSDRYNPHFSNEDIIAATIWGEARGEGEKGQRAIYTILKNRAIKKGNPTWSMEKRMAGEALRPKQFSYWNDKGFGSDPRNNLGKLGVNSKMLEGFKNIIKSDDVIPELKDATHYINKKKVTTRNQWWKSPKVTWVAKIGNHDFYREG